MTKLIVWKIGMANNGSSINKANIFTKDNSITQKINPITHKPTQLAT